MIRDPHHSAGIDGIVIIIVAVVHHPHANLLPLMLSSMSIHPCPHPCPPALVHPCPLALAGLALTLMPSSTPTCVTLAPHYRHQRRPLSPPSTTAIAAATVNDGNAKSQGLLFVVNSSNSRQLHKQSMAAAVMVSFPPPFTTMTGWWLRHQLPLHSQCQRPSLPSPPSVKDAIAANAIISLLSWTAAGTIPLLPPPSLPLPSMMPHRCLWLHPTSASVDGDGAVPVTRGPRLL